MLELGSAVIRTEPEVVLKSRWVVPERLDQAGYSFPTRPARTLRYRNESEVRVRFPGQ